MGTSPVFPAVDGMTAVQLGDLEAASAAPASPSRKFSLGRMLAQQDWASILATLLLSAGLLIAWACLGGPRQRPFSLYDATISYPYLPDTFSITMVGLVLGLALLASVLATELWLAARTHADATAKWAAALYFVLDGAMALLMNTMVTEVSKRVVGRMRPNFLAQCQPAGSGNAATVQWGQPASANSACTAPSSSSLTDAHLSFPSGHTSTAFVLAVWTSAYLLWALNVRLSRSQQPARLLRRLWAELGTCAGWAWTLALLGFAWATGVSRITDFKHHPSDVIAGAFLGTLVAAFYITRSIIRLPQVVARAPAAAAAGEQPAATAAQAAFMAAAH